jgi:outer membrane protein OmpA-like peptidoglycan-associated protein
MKRQLLGIFMLLLLVQFGVSQTPSSRLIDLCEFEIKHVGFNTKTSDFGPSFVNEDLWFSAYANPKSHKTLSGVPENAFYSLYKTPVDSRGFTLYEPRVLISDLKSGLHEGPVSFCEKTGELYVTLSNTVNFEVVEEGIVVIKEKIKLRLVICKKINGVWTIQKELPFNNPEYSVGHPSITTTGDTLFFTSDNPALSKGGTDIFMAVRHDSIWGLPIELGDAINTSGNEMFPFYHSSGMLVFSSNNRPGGKGGLDLFISDLEPDGFTSAKPLDMFNTKYDDFGLVIHQSGEAGYFVSTRPGQNGDDDIYLVKIRETYMQIKGTVIEDITGHPIDGAVINLYTCDGKKTGNTTTTDHGEFLLKALKGRCYVIGAYYPNYPEYRKSVGKNNNLEIRLKRDRSLEILALDFDTRSPVKNANVRINSVLIGQTSANGSIIKELSDDEKFFVDVAQSNYFRQTVEVEANENGKTRQTILLKKMEINKTFLIENVRFEKESCVILPVTEQALDKLVTMMDENLSLIIEICSHTDSRGSDQFNLNLSQKRAESVVTYLVQKGVQAERISAKGYGETQLLNRCKNGIRCNDQEHQVNNRTEFKIIGFMK